MGGGANIYKVLDPSRHYYKLIGLGLRPFRYCTPI